MGLHKHNSRYMKTSQSWDSQHETWNNQPVKLQQQISLMMEEALHQAPQDRDKAHSCSNSQLKI